MFQRSLEINCRKSAVLLVHGSASHSSKCAIGMPASSKISASIADSSERIVFHAKGCSLTPSRFPRRPVLLVRPQPPVRHIAAVAAVELLGNVVVTSWAATPIVRFGFMSGPHFKFVLHALSAVIIASRQPRQQHTRRTAS